MANEIKLTPDQMRERARAFGNERDNLQRSIDNMGKLISALTNEWKGEASKAYEKRYNDLKPAFKNCKALMNELSVNLNQSAKIMEETDRKIAGQLK